MGKRWKTAAAGVLSGVFGIGAAVLLNGGIGSVTVTGPAMAPAVKAGDTVLISKWSYLFDEPGVGDLVAFPCDVYSEEGEGSTLIRRVAATEGDLVEIRDGNLYINNKLEDGTASAGAAYMEPMAKIAVGPGKVFVLSDDRAAMLDSRDQAVGQLAVAELTGGVFGKIDGKQNE